MSQDLKNDQKFDKNRYSTKNTWFKQIHSNRRIFFFMRGIHDFLNIARHLEEEYFYIVRVTDCISRFCLRNVYIAMKFHFTER